MDLMDALYAPSHEIQCAVEYALDCLTEECVSLGIRLRGDDRAARAAEALAVYIKESQK